MSPRIALLPGTEKHAPLSNTYQWQLLLGHAPYAIVLLIHQKTLLGDWICLFLWVPKYLFPWV